MTAGQNSSQDRRHDIRRAALALFDAHGYANTTIDAVASEAGIAKGSIYNYFASKQALFLDVVQSIFGDEHAASEELICCTALSPTERMGRLFDLWHAAMPRYRQIGGLVLEFYAAATREGSSGETRRLMSDVFDHHRRMIAGIVRDGMAMGEFHEQNDPDNAATLIMAVIDGLTLSAILNHDAGSTIPPQIVDDLKDAVITALRNTSRPFATAPSPAGLPTAAPEQE